MKNVISFILALFAMTLANAQSFAPIGAKWHYTQWRLSPEKHYATVECVSDTIYQGRLCQKLLSQGAFCNFNEITYVHVSGDSVYVFDYYTDSLQLLYAFNAQVGNTWDFIWRHPGSDDTVTIEVEATFDTIINSKTLRTIVVKLDNSASQSRDTIIERVGSLYTFYSKFIADPFHYPCTGEHAIGLRCYEDDSIGLFETGIAPSCTHSTVGLEDPSAFSYQLSVWPNPVEDVLHVESEAEVLAVQVMDKAGREFDLPLQSDNTLHTNGLPAGVYVLKVLSREGTSHAKFIKQ